MEHADLAMRAVRAVHHFLISEPDKWQAIVALMQAAQQLLAESDGTEAAARAAAYVSGQATLAHGLTLAHENVPKHGESH